MKKARAMYIPAGGKTAVWGPVDHNVLPEGYPYKEASEERTQIWLGTGSAAVTITDGTHSDGNTGFVMYRDGECVIVFDGVEYPTGQDDITYL